MAKRMLFKSAVAVLLIFLLGVALFLVRHSSQPVAGYDRDLVVPLPAAAGDTTFESLYALIGDTLGKEYRNHSNCQFSEPHSEVCMSFLKAGRPTIKKLEEWLATKAGRGLSKPTDLGRRGRVKLPEPSYWAELPDYSRFIALSKFLLVDSAAAFREGKTSLAIDRLKEVAMLGDFLTQNPILVQLMIAHVIEAQTMQVIANYAPMRVNPSVLESLIPDAKTLIEANRIAMGSEWLSFRNYATGFIRRYPPSTYGSNMRLVMIEHWLASFTVSPKNLFPAGAHVFRWYQERADRPKLGKKVLEADYDAMWNAYAKSELSVLDRVWTHFLTPNLSPFVPYMSRTGHTIDKIEATRLVLAARRYRVEKKVWPGKPEDLAPKYIQPWPVSRIDGNLLHVDWKAKRVELPSETGEGACTGQCDFPFEPQERR